jgi:endonuclease-3
VNEVTKELFQKGSDPSKMFNLGYENILAIIKSLGLAPKKATYLVDLSSQLIERHNSIVPSSYEELEALTGVGHKTASVVMSQAFDQPAFAVDTHVHRLALRWGLTCEEKNVSKVQKNLCSAFPESSWNKVHLQMIYFGREYCTGAWLKHRLLNYSPCCHKNTSRSLILTFIA